MEKRGKEREKTRGEERRKEEERKGKKMKGEERKEEEAVLYYQSDFVFFLNDGRR